MQHQLRFILFLILVAFWGCTSIVRFSDKSTENKDISKSKESNTKKEFSTTNKEVEKKQTEIVYKTNTQRMLLEEAENWLGTPYRYGGTDRKGVDCSGLTYNVYLSIGTVLPRTAEQQYVYTKRISVAELDIGDLIFFASKGKISHVGIFAGNNTMIHASTSSGVIRQSLDSYTGQTVAGYGRP